MLASRGDQGQLLELNSCFEVPRPWRKEYVSQAYWCEDPIFSALLAGPQDGRVRTWEYWLEQNSALAPDELAGQGAQNFMNRLCTQLGVYQGAATALQREEGAQVLFCTVWGPRFVPEPGRLAQLGLTLPFAFDALRRKQKRRHQSLLTPRQKEVLNLSQRGLSIKQVAEVTQYSERSVHNHLSAIYERLDVFNKTHAVARAVSLGLIPVL
ncbi:MAG: LuxR C-terminal-related transcriptional regulator [bacterium]|nr:LuxR C-terminal-related transcriptional regulator [bacterium]